MLDFNIKDVCTHRQIRNTPYWYAMGTLANQYHGHTCLYCGGRIGGNITVVVPDDVPRSEAHMHLDRVQVMHGNTFSCKIVKGRRQMEPSMA
jgi:hypothetical protein